MTSLYKIPKIIAFTGLLTGCFVLNAAAQSERETSSNILSMAEANAELFGIWMEGETAQTKESWRECIQPDGVTFYQFGGVELVGKLTIQNDGKACFSYETSNYENESCFRVSRSGKGYTFWGGVEGIFTTKSIQHNVDFCPSRDVPTS